MGAERVELEWEDNIVSVFKNIPSAVLHSFILTYTDTVIQKPTIYFSDFIFVLALIHIWVHIYVHINIYSYILLLDLWQIQRLDFFFK